MIYGYWRIMLPHEQLRGMERAHREMNLTI